MIEMKIEENLQSFTKYLRKTLVFLLKNALRQKFNFCFWEIFANTGEIFISGRGLSTTQ